VVVTEGAAICAYLADVFPQAGLAPANNEERARYYRWLFFAAGPVEAAANAKAMGWEASADKERMLGFGSMRHVLDALEHALKDTPFIAGDRFTAADVYFGSHIMWGTQFGTLEKRPAFDPYMGRLHNRPAAVRARDLDDALIAEQQKQTQS
jgi:glutathione S-transferase